MKRFSFSIFFIFVWLQIFYVIQSGGGRIFPSKHYYRLLDEGSLDKILDDSDNDDSNQELTSESKSYENIDKISRVGRCRIQNNR